MRRICQQSRRWHQQFFPFARHPGHRQCVQQLWLPAPYQQRQYARTRGSDVVVHEYEQLGSNKKSRVPVDPKANLEATREYLKSKLEKIDKELAEMKEGPFGPNSEFMNSLSPEEREVALKALQKECQTSLEPLDDFDPAELDSIIEDQQQSPDVIDNDLTPRVTLERSRQHRAYVKLFNFALGEMAAGPQTDAKRINLWKTYKRCLYHMPDFLTVLPAKVWDMLLQSQVDLPDNAKNISALAKDALFHSMPLSTEQLVVYINALRQTGDLSLALERWKDNRSTLGPNPEVAKEFWALGVQLYCDMDQTDEAQNIAMQCIRHGSFADASILMPVIDSWVRKGTPTSLANAWTCYLTFKAESGAKFKREDYESISTALLNHGHPEMAIAVFKDMVLQVAKKDYGKFDSVSAFQKLAGHVGEAQSSTIDSEQVNKLSLTALTVLPFFLQNKFFYSSWIKKLIGLGEVDGAAQVVELMYERGIRPDARHLNGIVGAWLRVSSEASREKAEQMAWAMVKSRIDFVRFRETGKGNLDLIRSPEGKILPAFVNRLVPRATIETFSVLLLHYTRRCQQEAADELLEVMLRQAKIEPNAFMWNHGLHTSLRQQDLGQILDQYQVMKEKVMPDLQTFCCLWDAAKMQWDPSKAAHTKSFPTPRRLFKEMKDWMSQLPEAQLIRAKQEFSRELHDQIIRVFGLRQDLRGALCALHGLKQLFNEYPDDATSRIISILIGRLLPPDAGHRPSGPGGSRWRVSSMKTALMSVNDILQMVADQRAVGLLDRGLDPLNMNEATAKQLQLDVLSDLLLVILKKLEPEQGNVENEIRNVADAMDVDVKRVDFRKADLVEP